VNLRTLATSLAVSALAVAAPPAAGHFGFAGNLNLEFGGDEVARVYFQDQSEQSVRAGQGATLALGGHYRPADSNFDFTATVGYKFVTTKATNATISLNRTVFELRADYFLPNSTWIGAGPVWHSGIRLDADGLAPNMDFGTASGFTVKYGWKWIAASYTAIKYKDEFGLTYSGDAFGISLVGRF